MLLQHVHIVVDNRGIHPALESDYSYFARKSFYCCVVFRCVSVAVRVEKSLSSCFSIYVCVMCVVHQQPHRIGWRCCRQGFDRVLNSFLNALCFIIKMVRRRRAFRDGNAQRPFCNLSALSGRWAWHPHKHFNPTLCDVLQQRHYYYYDSTRSTSRRSPTLSRSRYENISLLPLVYTSCTGTHNNHYTIVVHTTKTQRLNRATLRLTQVTLHTRALNSILFEDSAKEPMVSV